MLHSARDFQLEQQNSELQQEVQEMKEQMRDDDAILGDEMPGLHSRLQATCERVDVLEQLLNDTKASALRDRQYYQQEMERMQQVLKQNNLLDQGKSQDTNK